MIPVATSEHVFDEWQGRLESPGASCDDHAQTASATSKTLFHPLSSSQASHIYTDVFGLAHENREASETVGGFPLSHLLSSLVFFAPEWRGTSSSTPSPARTLGRSADRSRNGRDFNTVTFSRLWRSAVSILSSPTQVD